MRDAVTSLFVDWRSTGIVQGMGSPRDHSGCEERAEAWRSREAPCDWPELGRRHAHGDPRTPPAPTWEGQARLITRGCNGPKTQLRVRRIDTGGRHAH